MRVLHFADLHLGVERYGHIDPETGLSTRLGDFLRALDQVVSHSLEENVDLVLFCGDAYRGREPSQTHQREFATRVKRLSLAGIPVFLLVGNHDMPNAVGKATAVEIFDTLSVSNVYVANRPGTCVIPTRSGPVQVVALPWYRRSVILSREESKGLSLDQLNDELQQRMTAIIAAQAQALSPELPSLLAGHVGVSSAIAGSERTMLLGKEPVLLPSAVANPAFDYVALGHVHRHQLLWDDPPVAYSGSLERIDFGDEDDEKGFYVMDIVGGTKKSPVFHSVESTPFLTIAVKIPPGDPDPTTTVLQAIARQGERIKGAVVRVQISLSAQEESLLRDPDISRALKEAAYCTTTRDVQRESRVRLGDTPAEGITPIEALRFWLDSKKTPDARRQLLIERAERLINQEMREEIDAK